MQSPEQLYLRYSKEFPEEHATDIYERVLRHYEGMLENEIPREVQEMQRTINLVKGVVDKVKHGEYLKQRVLQLKRRVQPAQRTEGWYALRNGMFTASSDIGNIAGTSYDHKNANDRDREHIRDMLILKKCGHDLKAFKGNFATRWGNMFEEVVTQLYSQRTGDEAWEFGLMQHEQYKFIGASPDAITPNGMMIEIKCPSSRKITGNVPLYYWTQMQVQLECCDLEECDFVECKFKKFNSEQACIRDKYCEQSGVLGEYYDTRRSMNDPDNRYYCYPPMGPMNTQKQYINEYETKHKFLGFVYWGLQKYSCVRVARDRAWFNKQLPKITEAWEQVVYYREHPDELEKLLEKAKAYEAWKNKPEPEVTTSLMDCLTSEDES